MIIGSVCQRWKETIRVSRRKGDNSDERSAAPAVEALVARCPISSGRSGAVQHRDSQLSRLQTHRSIALESRLDLAERATMETQGVVSQVQCLLDDEVKDLVRTVLSYLPMPLDILHILNWTSVAHMAG